MQRAYDLTLWLIHKVEKFPRSHRFTLGDRIIGRALDLLEALSGAAWAGANKGAFLDHAQRHVNGLRLLLRLAVDLKLLTVNAQEFAAAKLEEIGRMTAGWRKAVRARPE